MGVVHIDAVLEQTLVDTACQNYINGRVDKFALDRNFSVEGTMQMRQYAVFIQDTQKKYETYTQEIEPAVRCTQKHTELVLCYSLLTKWKQPKTLLGSTEEMKQGK